MVLVLFLILFWSGMLYMCDKIIDVRVVFIKKYIFIVCVIVFLLVIWVIVFGVFIVLSSLVIFDFFIKWLMLFIKFIFKLKFLSFKIIDFKGLFNGFFLLCLLFFNRGVD